MPIGREDYEERKDRRISSFEGKAAKAQEEADQYYKKSSDALRGIELGQPILAGHYSEKGHRAALEKSRSAMNKVAESFDKAAYYEEKAEAAAGNSSISGDDPEALCRYMEKLEKLEATQKMMKSVNAYWRKHKTMKGYPGMSDKGAEEIDGQMKTAYSWVQKNGPFESWKLSNNNAEIRRIKEKLETLKELDGMAEEVIKFSGGELRVDVDINRVQFIFDDKPSDEARSLLKSHGFRWAPSQGAWQRQRTLQAVRISKSIVSKLEEI